MFASPSLKPIFLRQTWERSVQFHFHSSDTHHRQDQYPGSLHRYLPLGCPCSRQLSSQTLHVSLNRLSTCDLAVTLEHKTVVMWHWFRFSRHSGYIQGWMPGKRSLTWIISVSWGSVIGGFSFKILQSEVLIRGELLANTVCVLNICRMWFLRLSSCIPPLWFCDFLFLPICLSQMP